MELSVNSLPWSPEAWTVVSNDPMDINGHGAPEGQEVRESAGRKDGSG